MNVTEGVALAVGQFSKPLGDALLSGLPPIPGFLLRRTAEAYAGRSGVLEGRSTPRPLGWFHDGIVYQQIILDNPSCEVFNVLTLNQGAQMKVTDYNLTAKNGRHIRKATMVTFPDGYEVKFIERMPKGAAIKQAKEVRPILERGWPYPTESA